MRHTLPINQAVVIPNPAEQKLVIHTAGRMSKGAEQPKEERTAATVAGINWIDAVFSTIRRQSSSPATLSFRFTASRRAAWIPMGVAAFPSPRKLAQIFALKLQEREGSVLLEGNSLSNSGFRSLDKNPVTPAFSITFPIPLQRQMVPAMDMASVTPACAPCGIAAATSLPLPNNNAVIKEIATIPVKIQLITMSTPPVMQIMRQITGKCYYTGN